MGARGSLTQVRYSSRSLALAGLALISFVAGLFITSILIFVSIPLVISLGFMILRSREQRAVIELARNIERVQLVEHEKCKVSLRVTNLGKKEIPFLQIRDLVPRQLEGDRTQNGFTLSLDAGETRVLVYEIQPSTFGIFSIGPINLFSSELFGLYEFEGGADLNSRLVVVPETRERLSKFIIRPRRTKPWPGEIASIRTGLGVNYYSVRPLINGEPLKRINWKASARASDESQLLVNEFMAELGAEALVIVDGRAISEIGQRPDSTFTYSIRAALSISERLLHERNRVGLLTLGARGTRIPTGQGRRQYNRILLALLELNPGESANLEGISRNLRVFYPHISQIVFVSSLIDDDAFRAAADISRSGYDLIVLSPNPLHFETEPSQENSRERNLARRLAQLERTGNIEQLRSANALVIDWEKSQNLEEVIEAHGRAWATHLIQTRR